MRAAVITRMVVVVDGWCVSVGLLWHRHLDSLGT
jgi:hypothetical protein